MTPEEKRVQSDRMRYTKDTLASSLVLAAIVLDALYFVSVYQTDVGSYYYSWQIGASIIYNLIFMLAAFLASEGVKNRKSGYWAALIGLGLMQFVRIFYLPARAHSAIVTVNGEDLAAMDEGQYTYVVICLAVSGICCLLAAVVNYVNNRRLALHMRSIENKTA